VVAHNDVSLEADVTAATLGEVEVADSITMVAIDELHLYDDYEDAGRRTEDAATTVRSWQRKGLVVMATTISRGSTGEPFYIFQQLKERGVVYRTIELKADCDFCGVKE
jgi:hypothetical protein